MSSRSSPYRPDRPIVCELAAGAVVRRPGALEILLLHDPSEDRWCFPKGHVEDGESLEATARREVAEETGIADLTLQRELVQVTYRFFRAKSDTNVLKNVVYFLAESAARFVRPEPIFDRFEWVDVARARERMRFPADVAVLDALERTAPQPPA